MGRGHLGGGAITLQQHTTYAHIYVKHTHSRWECTYRNVHLHIRFEILRSIEDQNILVKTSTIFSNNVNNVVEVHCNVL